VDLNEFFEAMKPLREAGKLACVLVQLPGFLRFDPRRLESFLSLLKREGYLIYLLKGSREM